MSDNCSAHILIVDSEAPNLDTLRMVLEERGHRCAIASTANAAWVMCLREKFDCMFLHATLDGASGLALADRLSHETYARPRHVILMSGYPRSDFLAQLRGGVVDGFLRKPAEPEEFLGAVERCLAAKRADASQ